MRFLAWLFIAGLPASALASPDFTEKKGFDQEEMGLIIDDEDVTATIDTHPLLRGIESVPMERWDTVEAALDPPDFKGNRAPAIDGPATDEPQGDSAYLYR